MKSSLSAQDFCVKAGKKVTLKDWPTSVSPLFTSKEAYRQLLDKQTAELAALQRLHYASNRHALLLIFQGMDTSGKDGVIRHVFSGVDPQGFQVFSFQAPSAEERDHDFLWRTNRRLPERGRIGIFNRSYYEEVLIARVHPELLTAQNLPPECVDTDTIWSDRYRSIVEMEAHLHRNGTRIVKFFLHLSQDEQKKRLNKRIDDPERNWKLSESDIEERKLWPDYIQAYASCLSATSTATAPWYIVPADDKKNTRLLVSQIVLEAYRALPMAYPKLTPERQQELQAIREQL